MKKKIYSRPFTGFLGFLLLMLIIGCIYTSMQVRMLTEKLEKTQLHIQNVQSISNTLDAEWAYLTRPERIERLSKVLLPKEKPVSAKDMVALDKIKQSDSVTAVSIGDITYNIFNASSK